MVSRKQIRHLAQFLAHNWPHDTFSLSDGFRKELNVTPEQYWDMLGIATAQAWMELAEKIAPALDLPKVGAVLTQMKTVPPSEWVAIEGDDWQHQAVQVRKLLGDP